MSASCRIESACRACRGSRLETVLDLGKQPPANAFISAPGDSGGEFPLTLCICRDCGLVQIRETLARESLFDEYVWITGTSSSARAFAEEFADMAVDVAKLHPGARVVEVASNDGTFLLPFVKRGFRVVGVDPAKNLAEIARARGLEIRDCYWDASSAEELVSEFGSVDFIFGRNVVAHVSELEGFVGGLAKVLRDGGCGALEFHWSAKILSGLQYDSIYHEHLCYFGLNSISLLLGRFGLEVQAVRESPISGGALIVFFRKDGRPDNSVSQFEKRESAMGLANVETWKEFGSECTAHAGKCVDLLRDPANGVIVGYGSSARSNTFLNTLGLGRDTIRCIIDNNSAKQGKLAPGSLIPIVSEGDGLALVPDTILALAWNFNREIQSRCRAAGFHGQWITAFPGKPSREVIT